MRDFKTSVNDGKRPKTRLDIAKENRLKRRAGAKSYRVSGKRSLFKGKFGKKLKKVLLVLLFVLIIGLTIGGIRVMAYLQEINDNLPTPDKVFPELPVASEIYDRKALNNDGTGTTLYRLFDQYNSDPVNIKEIPDTVKWSFLAAEDSDFYTHGGFDVTGLIRCGFAYLKTQSVGCGGSTITQQLVKITALTNEVSLDRKIKELLLATKVEQLYDKDTILEMYLRVAPFGSNIYGVKTAANFYFGKEPKDLDLAQAALIASIIQDPFRLSPTLSSKTEVFCRASDGLIVDENNVQTGDNGKMTDGGNEVIKALRVKCRQLYILNQMQNKITQINDQTRKNHDDPEMEDILTTEIIEAAKKEELEYRPPIFDKKAGHFVDYVLEALTSGNYKNGEEPFTTEDLQKGGYKIYTSLDYGIQQIAENYTAKAVATYGTPNNANNAAVMTTVPSTGEIIAMSGSKDYSAASYPDGCTSGQDCKFDGQVNIFTTPQSPGSSNKPMGYYMAYKNGQLFPGSLLPDIAMNNIDDSGYSPKNWNGGYLGINTAQEMLRQSRNLPAMSVIKLIGVDKYIETAREWGYTSYTNADQYGLSIILGGADVYPDEHVQAYSVFANDGDLVKLNPILKIIDRDGKTIYEAKPERKTVGDAQAAYLLNQTLYKNEEGNIGFDGRDYAAKTGTSEDSKDAWTMMWSPDFVTLAWAGNNNNEPMSQDTGYPYYVIFPWLKQYMSDIGGASYFSAKTAFPRPGFVYRGGGDCNDDGCLGLQANWLIEGKTPPRDIIKKNITVCSDQPTKIARAIDIAMGMAVNKEFVYYKMPVPEWQHFLDDYVKNSEGRTNFIPTEQCDVDRSGGTSGPFFGFTALSGTTTSINIKGGIFTNTSGGTITSNTFYLDNKVIPSCTPSSFASFDVTCNISSLNIPDTGRYLFKSTATDSSGITNTSISYTMNIGSVTTGKLSFITPPFSGSGLGVYNVDIQFSGSYSIGAPTLYMSKNGAGGQSLGAMTPIGGNKYRMVWNSNTYGSGSYVFYATAQIQGSTGIIQSNNSSEVHL